MKWYHRHLLRFRFYRNWVEKTKSISLSRLGSFTLHQYLADFFQEIEKENIFIKSSALAFQFLLAIFPGLIFLFTLIAFIPIPNFQENVLSIFQNVLPDNVYDAVEDTLKEVVIKKNGGLLSFGFLAALYFSTSGMATLIQSLHKNSQKPDTRTYLAKRLLALFLTICLTFLLLMTAFIVFASQSIIHYFQTQNFIKTNLESLALNVFQMILVSFLLYIAFALLYYFGPKKSGQRKFFTVGAALASIASLATTEGFAFYVSHFSNYNKIYGSIGTLIVLMGLLYLNAAVLLIGYDIELSIINCQKVFNANYSNHSSLNSPVRLNRNNQKKS